MLLRAALILILLFGGSIFAQSGRHAKPPAPPTPTPTPQETPSPTLELVPRAEPVTAEKDQDYRCTNDGSLAHLLEPPTVAGFSPKEVDTKAEITARPEPGYTREARRYGMQGVVVLKLLLLADGKLDRVRVVRRLPLGLTENAIRAACEIKFKPAVKAGKEVSQWVTLEYVFRLANSSIAGN